MGKVLIVFESKGPLGALDGLAAQIARGVQEGGLEAECRPPEACSLEDIAGASALILGSPSHYGGISARMKELCDRTYELHGKLEGRVGACFCTSRHVGGGNETTLLSFHMFFLIHGMIVQGDPQAAHYGPFVVQVASDEAPVVDDAGQAHRLGRRVAALVKRLG
jgi:NAD(P)H dehydrogenase (quinone)